MATIDQPRPSFPAIALATVVGNLAWVAASFLFGLLAVLGAWIPPRGAAAFFSARWWSRVILAASGVRLTAHWPEPADHGGGSPRRPAVYMANHQSMYDIPALLASLPQRTQFLAKKSLFRIPIFGWGLRLGAFVPVDREDRRRARESFTAAAERLAAGDSVLVFPEETRSPDGALLPFKKGGFLLALKGGMPIVPVGIRGTFAVRRRGSLKISPSRIEVRYGGPIEVASYGVKQREELMAEVRRRIAELADTFSTEPDGC